ncbi:MAG: CSLREA domain-containing protein [Planctomycetia bacterium]|nr:CSLREA domain-containing protein [Planctomycetia bacterium]
MLFRSGRNWIVDFLISRGWLSKPRRLHARRKSWNPSPVVAAECLEDRTLLSTITVTTLADDVTPDGQVTLREAIQAANTASSVDGSVTVEVGVQNSIVFQAGLVGTIALDPAVGTLTISSSLKIEGLGATSTIIDAQQNSRVFDVTSSAGDVALGSLAVTNGKTTFKNDFGAGIRFLSSGALTLSSCTISANSTTGSGAKGAGIYTNTGSVTLLSSTVSGNSTTGQGGDGAGIFADWGAVSLFNSTMSGNSTAGYHSDGAAIYTVEGGDVILVNSTVTANVNTGANATGGAVDVIRGSMTIRNSIVSGNTIAFGTSPDITFVNYHGSATFSAKNCLIGVDSGTPLAAAPIGSPDANGNFVGTFGSPFDAHLGALADNGTSTHTHALLLGSAAINAGSNALAVGPDSNPLTNDQRGSGFARIQNGAVDMGSFEFSLPALPLVVATAADVLHDNVTDANQMSLRDAVAIANARIGADSITFAASLSGTPINLTLGELLITDALQVAGSGAKNTIVDAKQNSRVFDVTRGAGDVTFSGLTITGGKTTSNFDPGGGVRFLSTGALMVADSSVVANQTTGSGSSGGGLYSKNGPVTVLNSTVSGNSTVADSVDGGGIFTFNGSLAVFNSTLSGNSTSGLYSDGGAFYAENGDVTLTNSSVTGNSTVFKQSEGGGIKTVRGSLTLRNSIVSGNTVQLADSTSAIDIKFTNYAGTATFTASRSLIGVNTTTPLAATVENTPDANGNFVGTFASPFNAHLGALAENGGQVKTHALLLNSAAINAGSNALALGPGSVPLTTDERGAGFARIVGTVDMGAYEVQVLSAPTVDFLVTANSLPALTGTYDQQDTKSLQVTLNGSVFTLGTSSQLASDGTGNWTLSTTAAIPDGQYNAVVTSTDPSGNTTTDPTTVDLIVNTAAPAVTHFAGTYAAKAAGSNTLSLATIAQNGAQLNLTGSTAAAATITSTTQLSVAGVTALYGDSRITFGSTGSFAGEVWTKLDLPTDFTNPAGARVHILQNDGAVTFVDRNGKQSPGAWVSPTQLSAYGEDVTIGSGTSSGQLLWDDGTIWSEAILLQGNSNAPRTGTIAAVPSQVLVTDYLTGSGATVHAVQTGTTNIVFVDRVGSMVLGTYSNQNTSVPQATAPGYPGYTASIVGNTITWTDGNPADTIVWTKTSAPASTITVTDYTNQNGVPVHLIRNGTNRFVIVDGMGRTSLGHFLSPTTGVVDAYPDDMATFTANQVIWEDGIFVWTKTNNPPLLITFRDGAGAVSHVKLLSAATLVGLDGPLKGVKGVRLNGKIFWANGDVWSNFDFDALNAFFLMGAGLS